MLLMLAWVDVDKCSGLDHYTLEENEVTEVGRESLKSFKVTQKPAKPTVSS